LGAKRKQQKIKEEARDRGNVLRDFALKRKSEQSQDEAISEVSAVAEDLELVDAATPVQSSKKKKLSHSAKKEAAQHSLTNLVTEATRAGDIQGEQLRLQRESLEDKRVRHEEIMAEKRARHEETLLESRTQHQETMSLNRTQYQETLCEMKRVNDAKIKAYSVSVIQYEPEHSRIASRLPRLKDQTAIK
jgi:hypothetical protein